MSLISNRCQKKPFYIGYGIAIVIVIASFLFRKVLSLGFGSIAPFLLFIPAIATSAWYGGFNSGLLATGLSAVIIFLEWSRFNNTSLFSPLLEISLTQWVYLAFFVVIGFQISRLCHQSFLNQKQIANKANTPQFMGVEKNALGLQAGERTRSYLKDLLDIQSALDHAAIVAITDRWGKITYVNDKFCQLSKYSREELIGQDHRILNSGHHPQEFFRNFWAMLLRGEVWQGEIKNRAKDGTYYWVDTTVVPLLNDDKEPVQYLAIRFDITSRKQAEIELQQLNNQLESLVERRTAELQQSLDFEASLKRITDKMRDSLDESQIMQTAVQELAEVLGANSCNASLYDLNTGISTIYYEHNPSIFKMEGHVSQMANSPEIYDTLLQGQHIQFCNLHQHPIRGRVTMLACPMFDDREAVGDLWLIIDKEYAFRESEIRLVQQVADQCAIGIRQARLYQTAQAQVKVLEQLNWLKDDFLSTVSHELRTPVSNMKLSIHMLELVLTQLIESRPDINADTQSKASRYLQILHNECEREIHLINDLLDLQRLETGKRTIIHETIYLQQWLPQVVQSFQERAQARQQLLSVNLPEMDLPPLVSDISALERIVDELINNACKYTPPGERIVVSVCAKPGTVKLVVTNFGVEIPAQEIPHIFDKFYRVPNSDPWRQGGTGLGLALVTRLVQHLDGVVTVSSEDNQTTFTVEVVNHLVAVPS